MYKVFLRSFGFGIGFFVALLATMGIAHAASGGLFGEVLNLILTGSRTGMGGKNWENPGDGTVANSEKLGGLLPSRFQQVAPNQSCGAGKCIYGYDPSGNILCR